MQVLNFRELMMEGNLPKNLHSYDYRLLVFDAEHVFLVDESEKFEESALLVFWLDFRGT